MALVFNSELFFKNITEEELIELYIMGGGRQAFFIRDRTEAFEYMIKSILDAIGYEVDTVTLKKESLFQKAKKTTNTTKKKIPYKAAKGISKHDFIFSDYLFKKIGIEYNFEDFESKYKHEEYENLNLPEVNSDEHEKISDLNIFGMEWSPNNVSRDHMFLVNNLKTFYYKRARVLHPDRGGDANEFTKLSNAYEKLLKLRE